MSKERFLTILVPITDGDCESGVYASLAALVASVPVSMDNVNKIYRLQDGTYARLCLNTSTGQYEYRVVVDREFPYLGKPLEIFDFTYNATRMGTAPTISAQNVMWFAEKDADGNDVTLEGMWKQECHVSFNGENFYLKQVPTSSKSNEDARYKYDIDFVAERVILERVYLYDVVSPFITAKPVSESTSFSFYGDINEFAKRINASLIRSGLAMLTRKYVAYPNQPSSTVPYLTYEQWNQLNVDPVPLVGTVFTNVGELNYFRTTIYTALGGDYNQYLMQYIYANDNGVYALTGYQCIIGKDKEGDVTTSDEKLITFEKKTIHEALQEFHDTFELQYYIVKEKDDNGEFTGNTLIVVADCEHDFAETEYVELTSQPSDWLTNYMDYYELVDDEYVHLDTFKKFDSGTFYKLDYTRDDDGIPTTENPFDYGAENELLAKEKTNTTDKIVTRITGVGSSENIPWYYPNPNPDGWIKPIFTRGGVEQTHVTIEYPTDEGSTITQAAIYEKYLKNRIGNAIKHGKVVFVKFANEYRSGVYYGDSTKTLKLTYAIDTTDITYKELTLEFNYNPEQSGCNRVVARLLRGSGAVVGTYDSSETYEHPTAFQSMFITHDGSVSINLEAAVDVYFLEISYYIPSSAIPLSQQYHYEGYHYPSVTYNSATPPNKAYIRENFYNTGGLQPFVVWGGGGIATNGGYSTDGMASGKVSPIPRRKDRQYKDATSGTIYKCNTSEQGDIKTSTYQTCFTANPVMGWQEWLANFVQMTIRVWSDDGWYIGGEKIILSDYGLGDPSYEGSEISCDIGDAIEFQRVKYITPQPNLMPEVYIKTDGERRCYNAHNYWDKDNSSLYDGTADTMIGEEQVGTKVRNPIFKENETDPDSKHYEFENEYIQQLPHEHIEDFEDVKPTIKEQKNYMYVDVTAEQFNDSKTSYYTKNENGAFIQCTNATVYDPNEVYYMLLRIDVVDTFAYDDTDNDEIWESNNDGNTVQGEYKHPYFFAKLRPLGFNIFDLALQDDMVLSMTTGNCGSCNFKIAVDENTMKNPVQIWEYDVYGGETYSTKGNLIYEKGELRRYVDTRNLYYNTDDTEDGYVQVDNGLHIEDGGMTANSISSTQIFESTVYSEDDVANGLVGSTKQKGKWHFEGDVVTNGKLIDIQQDTTEEYVWVALTKDTDTYGVIMPAARPNYEDHQLDVYIDPKGINYTDRTNGQTTVYSEEDADKFVLVNIKMPQVYLRRAERDLSRKLVAYMYDNNYEKFNFSIKFSRIFLAQNGYIDALLNENSVLYVDFNNRTYRQYVKNYTYRMTSDAVLPEISVDMNEELGVSKTIIEQQVAMTDRKIKKAKASVTTIAQQQTERAVRGMSAETYGETSQNVIPISPNSPSRDDDSSQDDDFSNHWFGTQYDYDELESCGMLEPDVEYHIITQSDWDEDDIGKMPYIKNKPELVTSISSNSTDKQFPSAKCVYDIVGDIETLLAAI